MEAKQEGEVWTVESDTGHTYKVTSSSCTCPQFLFRVKKSGGSCKHMDFVNGLISKDANYDEIIKFIRFHGRTAVDDLQKEFGLEIINKLQALEKRGEIIYNRRNDTYSILE